MQTEEILKEELQKSTGKSMGERKLFQLGVWKEWKKKRGKLIGEILRSIFSLLSYTWLYNISADE